MVHTLWLEPLRPIILTLENFRQKDHPSYVFRVFAFFRQSVSKYNSWDARTADIKIIVKKVHLTGGQVD